ncbi:MAG TPA: hypothetical protein VEI46_12140 [Thermodesulfovibrionales bacterium]|nr:hypothetical protein [Thermodesulfovibrionales bacterium]
MVSLEIAGIRFAIAGQDCIVHQRHEPAYEDFLNDAADTPPDVEVSVLVSCLPDISDTKRIFSSDSSWSLWAKGDDNYLILDPPAIGNGPLWIAKFTLSLKRITIFCGKQLVTHEGGDLFVPNPMRYPLDQIFLMHYLGARGGAILHAAGVGINNKGYLFPGRSGAGKSTLIRQFLSKQYGEVLSDDRIVARKVEGAFTAFGTPWPGEADIAINKGVPISGIFFISHGDGNRIRDLGRKEAFERLLPVASIPWYDSAMTEKLMVFCEDILCHVPAYELSFKPTEEVVDILENFSQ